MLIILFASSTLLLEMLENSQRLQGTQQSEDESI